MTTFAREGQIIKVIVSTTAAAFAPIFDMETTALMNHISYDWFYCTYPTLTFNRMAMINLRLLYTRSFCKCNMEMLLMYHSRGFIYMGCHDNMEISVPCSSVSQSMMNTTGLWWDHEAMSCSRQNLVEVHKVLLGNSELNPD